MNVWKDTGEKDEDFRKPAASEDAVDGGGLFLQGQPGHYRK